MASVTAATVRDWQIEQLRKGVAVLRNILNGVSAQDATTYRDGGSGWTVLEVMCHLRDYEGLFQERASLTVEQDSPALPNPNPDELAREKRYSEENLEAVYQEWKTRRTAFVEYLAGLDESAWARTGEHPKRGTMSLQDQLALCAFHDVNHVEQILHILADKKLPVG
jgi:uncharacterized damage-inducible protein DinB